MNRLMLIATVASLVVAAQSTGAAGTWVGAGTLTNDWAHASNPRTALRCVYTGKAQPPAITLTIPSGAGVGQLVLDIASSSGACPPLRKRFQIRAERVGTRLTFTDPAGDRWSLIVTDDLLSGDVTWSASEKNPSEALAVGFAYSAPLRPWDVPLTRLSGKVTLRRAVPPREPRGR